MGVGEAVIVAGIGCRKGASAAEIEAVIAAALERAGFAQETLGAIAAPADKGENRPPICFAKFGERFARRFFASA